LYRMATGRLPFRGDSTMAVLTSLALDTPPAPQTLNPAIPAELDELIMQLLAKDPAQRPASAQDVADRLGQLGERLRRAEAEADHTAEMTAPGSVGSEKPRLATREQPG